MCMTLAGTAWIGLGVGFAYSGVDTAVGTQMRMLRQGSLVLQEYRNQDVCLGLLTEISKGLTKNYPQTEELKAARCLLKLPLHVPQCATNLTKAFRPHSSQALHARRVVIIMCTFFKL